MYNIVKSMCTYMLSILYILVKLVTVNVCFSFRYQTLFRWIKIFTAITQMLCRPHKFTTGRIAREASADSDVDFAFLPCSWATLCIDVGEMSRPPTPNFTLVGTWAGRETVNFMKFRNKLIYAKQWRRLSLARFLGNSQSLWVWRFGQYCVWVQQLWRFYHGGAIVAFPKIFSAR